MEIDLEDGRISNPIGNSFQDQFKDWSVSVSVIGSELAAYFPNSNIAKEWNTLINITKEFYSITATNQSQRIPHLKIMEEIILSNSIKNYLDIQGLKGEDNTLYWDAKNQMEKYITNQKEKIIKNSIFRYSSLNIKYR